MRATFSPASLLECKSRIPRRGNRHNCPGQKNLSGMQMRYGSKNKIYSRREKYPYEGKQIRRSSDATLLSGCAAMLNACIERNGVESSKKTEHRQIHSHAPNPQPVLRHKEPEDGHSQSSHRNQPRFNFSEREVASREASESYPDAHGSLQVADLCFVDVQNVMPVNNDYKLKKRGQKPQVRIAHDCPSQNPVVRDDAELASEIAERVYPESPRRIGGGHARYSKAREESK